MKIFKTDSKRLEQTELLVSTLRYFGHGDKVDYRLLENSSHCDYLYKDDENGMNRFAKMVYAYISKLRKKGN